MEHLPLTGISMLPEFTYEGSAFARPRGAGPI
jgi:hypothetical protein